MSPVSPNTPNRSRSARGSLQVAFAAVAVLLMGLVFVEPKEPATQVIRPTDEDRPAEEVDQTQMAVGIWQDEYKGKRTMTLREDGTGTMLVELSGMQAMLFAKRLTFDMVWSIEDGRMKKQSLGGEPAAKVSLVLKMMGDSVDEPILELNNERLLLLDADGETKYDWRRVE